MSQIHVNPAFGGKESRVHYETAIRKTTDSSEGPNYYGTKTPIVTEFTEKPANSKRKRFCNFFSCCCCGCGGKCPFKNFREFKEFLYPFLLIVWDGMGFFGFDDTKLARLRGVPVTFLSKFTSVRWIIFTIGSLLAALAILVIEGMKFGQVRTVQVSLELGEVYNYDVKSALPLMLVNWYWLNELFPKVHKFQNKHKDNQEVF